MKEETLPYTKMIRDRIFTAVEKLECSLPKIPDETTSIWQMGFQECQKMALDKIKTMQL